jgi:hypothetical protein
VATKTLPDNELEMAQRPQARSKQIGVRLTEDEYAEFERLAWKSGRTIAMSFSTPRVRWKLSSDDQSS